MLAILGLCWGYVRQFMLKKSSDTTFTIFPSRKAKALKKTYVFRHRQDEILARQGARNPVKGYVGYKEHIWGPY